MRPSILGALQKSISPLIKRGLAFGCLLVFCGNLMGPQVFAAEENAAPAPTPQPESKAAPESKGAGASESKGGGTGSCEINCDIKVDSVSETSAGFTFTPTKAEGIDTKSVTKTIEVGKSSSVDLDGDGKADLKVTLVSTDTEKDSASYNIEKLHSPGGGGGGGGGGSGENAAEGAEGAGGGSDLPGRNPKKKKNPKCKGKYCVELREKILKKEVITGDGGFGLILDYVVTMYKWGAAILGIICVLVIVFSGARIMLGGLDPDQIGEAKTWIGAAVGSLVLLFLITLVLRTVNPGFFTLT